MPLLLEEDEVVVVDTTVLVHVGAFVGGLGIPDVAERTKPYGWVAMSSPQDPNLVLVNDRGETIASRPNLVWTVFHPCNSIRRIQDSVACRTGCSFRIAAHTPNPVPPNNGGET